MLFIHNHHNSALCAEVKIINNLTMVIIEPRDPLTVLRGAS